MNRFIKNALRAASALAMIAIAAMSQAQDTALTNSSWYNSYAAEAIAASRRVQEARANSIVVIERSPVIYVNRHNFHSPRPHRPKVHHGVPRPHPRPVMNGTAQLGQLSR